MRVYARFPREPEVETTISSTEFVENVDRYSNRIFGYITPKTSGSYIFALSSDDFSEFWLSSDSSPKNVKLTAHVGKIGDHQGPASTYRVFTSQSGQISQPVNLTAGSVYYMEALHRQHEKQGHFTLAWSISEKNRSDFALVDPEVLSPYFDGIEESEELSRVRRECIMSDHRPLEFHKVPRVSARELKDERDDYCYKVPKLNHSDVADILPYCYYMASYVPQRKVSDFWCYIFGLAKPTDVFPNDKTGLLDRPGNKLISQKEVNQVVNEYLAKLSSRKRDAFRLKKIVNVEKKVDIKKGFRYLLELELAEQQSGRTVRLSEFVYKYNEKYISENPNTTRSLCYPEGFQWSQSPTVYLILPVQNYGFWIKYLVDRLSHIYTHTPEKNFHLVMVDFNTTDIDIDAYLQKSALNRSYTLVRMKGHFFKTLAINTGVATVKDNNSIIFLMDLHITVPSCFFDTIRKHVVKGKAGFFPSVLRLHCGGSDLYPRGFWEHQGYGLFGCYKEDWERFGGEDVEKFRHNWGGEDWDLLDRVCGAQLEPERMDSPKLYHFPHVRRGSFYVGEQKKKTS
ncbi:beta-1,4-N-acetylgalactosaminyltransferase 3 isoform X2 [Nematostella vectensis]|nr:beta-1,4-N-acetylgalactosaminyltransferase 3 isoform X2 [Nematostella vectensis]